MQRRLCPDHVIGHRFSEQSFLDVISEVKGTSLIDFIGIGITIFRANLLLILLVQLGGCLVLLLVHDEANGTEDDSGNDDADDDEGRVERGSEALLGCLHLREVSFSDNLVRIINLLLVIGGSAFSVLLEGILIKVGGERGTLGTFILQFLVGSTETSIVSLLQLLGLLLELLLVGHGLLLGSASDGHEGSDNKFVHIVYL